MSIARKVIGFPRARTLIISHAVDAIFREIGVESLDVVAGGETAGIAYAAWIAETLGLPMPYIRKKPKGFGRDAQIEGMLPEGARTCWWRTWRPTAAARSTSSTRSGLPAARSTTPGRVPLRHLSAGDGGSEGADVSLSASPPGATSAGRRRSRPAQCRRHQGRALLPWRIRKPGPSRTAARNSAGKE